MRVVAAIANPPMPIISAWVLAGCCGWAAGSRLLFWRPNYRSRRDAACDGRLGGPL